ncbi:MAG: hypothetical protein R2824_02450 [Saprospiraceae bacterium]|nr:hypothetical protein [Lewinella sp.]
MDWSSLFNGLSELVVVAIIFVFLCYLVFSINLKLLGTSRSSFALNEAISIYLFGTFAALAMVCKPMLLALHSNLTVRGADEGIFIFQLEFYKLLFILVVIAAILYSLLFSFCIFLYTKLTFSVNEINDIKNNNRRSAIVLCGLLIAVFYTSSFIFDMIFSNVFQNPVNDFIF